LLVMICTRRRSGRQIPSDSRRWVVKDLGRSSAWCHPSAASFPLRSSPSSVTVGSSSHWTWTVCLGPRLGRLTARLGGGAWSAYGSSRLFPPSKNRVEKKKKSNETLFLWTRHLAVVVGVALRQTTYPPRTQTVHYLTQLYLHA
jgi:hypothetical protein